MKPIIHKNVSLGKSCVIEDDVEIGRPGKDGKYHRTVIGNNCHFRRGTIIYADTTLGKDVSTGHYSLIREGNKIGDHVVIGSFTELGLRNTIGDNTLIHSRCFLEDVTLGKDVFVGPGVIFTNDPHPSCPQFRSCFEGATIGDGAMIGGSATILPGVNIGKKSLVGAGSVVTHDVVPRSVVVGSPAREIKKIEDIICHSKGKTHKPYAKDAIR